MMVDFNIGVVLFFGMLVALSLPHMVCFGIAYGYDIASNCELTLLEILDRITTVYSQIIPADHQRVKWSVVL